MGIILNTGIIILIGIWFFWGGMLYEEYCQKKKEEKAKRESIEAVKDDIDFLLSQKYQDIMWAKKEIMRMAFKMEKSSPFSEIAILQCFRDIFLTNKHFCRSCIILEKTVRQAVENNTDLTTALRLVFFPEVKITLDKTI